MKKKTNPNDKCRFSSREENSNKKQNRKIRKNCTKEENKMNHSNLKSKRLITLVLYKNFKPFGGWAGKPAMADATKTTARPIGHLHPGPSGARENVFHLFRFIHPAKITHTENQFSNHKFYFDLQLALRVLYL